MAAFAAALLLALLALTRTGSAAEAVVLQLAGPATFENAGYYAALWQGFYREAGLDVTIRPGGARSQTPVDPAREVAEGRAQFGIGTMQLVIRRAQGLPVLLLAPIFQQSGAAVYYRGDSDFSSPAALLNARLGRLAASDVLDIELATALRAEAIDPAKIKSLTVAANQIVPALADRTIDAAVGSAWVVPWQAHERGVVLKSFNPSNYRVEYYGDSLFTLQRLAAAEPETVERFRAATLKGWDYALRHPDDMIARLIADKPGEPPVADIAGFDRYQADVARRLSRFAEIPLGYSNLDRWTQIEASMVDAGILERGTDLSDFVYSPPEKAPSRGAGLPQPVVLAAVVLGALILLATVWWLTPGLRRRVPAPSKMRLPRIPLPRLRWPSRRIRPAEGFAEPVEPAATIAVARRPRPLQPPNEPQPPPPLTNLNDVLTPLERRIRQRVRGKVRCRFSLLPDLWPCHTEGGPVAACVLDLVSAAARAMDADGTLIVGTRNFTFTAENIADYPGARLGAFARITVRDNGPGLTDPQFAQILDPGATSRPAVAHAAEVMARLGGFVRVESAAGVGTAVHLYFERIDEAAPGDELPAAAVAE
jgi:ABC-type nitrate/sulfonate/bicarbonate transport system substrate-binding protein